ncbi:MAG: DUF4148 domain-containing protein [Propionivibrio sp.]|nr:DUF4148 domain-containing protein [Propionivibrio sp.]
MSSSFSSRLIVRTIAGAFVAAATFSVGGGALAEQPTMSTTRAQVLAELAEAKRTGDLVWTYGGTMKKLNEFFPNNYPRKTEGPGMTREQVLAELAEARRTGEIVSTDGGKKLNEISPHSYPPKSASSAMTREQVLAELEEAKRTGELVSTSGGTMKKLNEFFPSAYPKGS